VKHMGQNGASSEPEKDRIKQLYDDWKRGLTSIRSAAERLNTPKSTLFRQFQKLKKAEDAEVKAKASQPPTDEELEKLKSEVEAAKYQEELAEAKYLMELERNHHRRKAWKYQRMSDEYEASHDPQKMVGFVEKVLSEDPEKLSEIRRHLERLGLTFEEFVHKELLADDYQERKQSWQKLFPNDPFRSLTQDIIRKVDGWLDHERIQAGKLKARLWMRDHPVDYKCPECGSKLSYTESGDFSCSNLVGCGWEGFYKCPNCKSRMMYDPSRKALCCTDILCRIVWR